MDLCAKKVAIVGPQSNLFGGDRHSDTHDINGESVRNALAWARDISRPALIRLVSMYYLKNAIYHTRDWHVVTVIRQWPGAERLKNKKGRNAYHFRPLRYHIRQCKLHWGEFGKSDAVRFRDNAPPGINIQTALPI